MPTCPMNINARPPWLIAAAVVGALVLTGLPADPAILFLAPFAIPILIWHRTRRNWLVTDRSMRCALESRQQRRRRSVRWSPPPAFKRRASGPAPAGQKRRQILIVRYRKELR